MRIFLTGGRASSARTCSGSSSGGGDHDVALLLKPDADLRRIEGLLDRTTPIVGDLFDLGAVAGEVERFEPDAVVHLGWSGVGAETRDDPGQVRNIEATAALLGVAGRAGAVRFVGLGSQAEYGPCTGRITEETPTSPTTLYGIAKLAAGSIARRLCGREGVRFAWLRAFTLYGPGDNPGWMLPKVSAQLVRGERPRLTSGEQLWDYLYVEDAAEAVVATLLAPSASGVFNLASGRPISIRRVVEMARDRVDPRLELGFGEVPHRPDQVMRMEVDVSRIARVVGWRPRVGLGEGLSRTIRAHVEAVSAASLG